MFSQLLRRSRLAGLEQQPAVASELAAVYVPTLNNGKDYGLKRAVPKSLQTEAIHVQDMDKGGLVRVNDASWTAHRYSMLSQLAIQLTDTPIKADAKQKEISQLSEQEFQELLAEARKKRSAFLNETQYAPIQRKSPTVCSQFMGLHQRSSLQQDIRTNESDQPALQYLRTQEQKDLPRVRGRVLERTSGGYLIGVGGVVAMLPQSQTSGIAGWNPEDRRKLYDFYVEEMQQLPNGRVQMKLTTDPKIKEKSSSAADKLAKRESQTEMQLQSLLADLLSDKK